MTEPPDEKSSDELRDEVLLRMLRTKPKRNAQLKLGKPRNPRQKAKAKNQAVAQAKR
jgi:hypothetical protein